MNKNDLIHGFRITNIRHSDELKADCYEMIHEQTGARTLWLKRDDENKTFSIAFKTTPHDDTGVFHILEHSVLNGSQRYPVREPFVDLLKGSLQTFLNAMTYPDKTVYPVSSRNDKDFINLMRVYLDAVFHPLVLQNPFIFYQEGWHYELNDKNDEPIYKGVVFNEMKGAFSSPDNVRSRYLLNALFPDNCYAYESGGDPDYITSLTYEQFCNAHHTYYNPSNSYIFLDGDMNIEEVLGIINDEYLSNYGKEGDKIEIIKQQPVIVEDQIIPYEISAESDPEGKAQIVYGYVLGDFDDYETTTAMSMITQVLCSSNESPLKKAILENGLGEDVSFDVQDGILQPYVEIDVINTDLDKEEKITAVISDVLKKIVAEGIDRKELEATINQREFMARERDFGRVPKGLVYDLGSLDSWLYGGDPLAGICVDKLYASLREKLDSDFYEQLLEKYILASSHRAKILLKPSNTLGSEKIEKETARLHEAAAKWTEDEKDKLLAMNTELVEWQSKEDTPEQKATLPALHLEDLKKTPSFFALNEESYGDNKVITHEADTNGISYASIYAKANDFTLEEYMIIGQLFTLYTQLPTEKYDVVTLNTKMRSILGNFDVTLAPMLSVKDRSQRNYACVSWSSLYRNDPEAAELVKEIIYHTDYSDAQAIHNVLKQNLITLEQTYINSGNSLALQRSMAYSSPVSVISEYVSGYETYRFMKKLDAEYEEKADWFRNELIRLRDSLFIKERYLVSLTGEDKDVILPAILDDAPHGEIGAETLKEPLGNRKEGIIVPANISYAAKSANLSDQIRDNGIMYVIANILTYDYLWTNIRVKGGAYGCGFRSGWNRQPGFYSFRDPDPANSLKIYEETPEYLRSFVQNCESIENYIVGTTGDYDPLQSLKSQIKTRDIEYLIDITYELKQQVLDSILSADKDKILATLDLFEQLNQDDNICVIGNAEAIARCGEKLEKIFDLNQI